MLNILIYYMVSKSDAFFLTCKETGIAKKRTVCASIASFLKAGLTKFINIIAGNFHICPLGLFYCYSVTTLCTLEIKQLSSVHTVYDKSGEIHGDFHSSQMSGNTEYQYTMK